MFSKKLLASAAVISFAVAGAASAQETTSAVRGNVRSTDGAPVAGAQVVVTHGPTGAVSAEYADAGGVFDLRGLRVGGPYTIEVTADDYQGQRLDNVFLQVGTPFRVALDLEPSTTEIVVTATRSGTGDTFGSATALGRDDIAGVVTVQRDIRDFARRDPLVTQDVGGNRGGGGQGGISIAGSSPRSNRITVDGMQAGDDFGLVTNGLSTLRGPVSIDAIQQFSVQAVPFDVENGDFTGGALNVVLRQGTNDFTGVAFVNYLNEGLVGQRIDGRQNTVPVSQQNFGAFFGGPIIEDKLFFALSYEYYESLDVTNIGFREDGLTGVVGFTGTGSFLTRDQVDSVLAPSVANQGYVGNYAVASAFAAGDVPVTGPVGDEKYTARLDWDINADHRASLSYRTAESALLIRQLTTTRMDLDSSWYQAADTEEVVTGQFNSNWSSNFSTELRASFRNYERRQSPPAGQEFGAVQVCFDGAPGAGAASGPVTGSNTTCGTSAGVDRTIVDWGPDQFRHANYLNTTNTQINASGEYQLGRHVLKAGYQYQGIEIDNLFVPTSDGVFYFDTIDGFNQGQLARLQYNNTVSGDPTDAAAVFAYDVHSLFVQDTWDLTDDLTIAYGLRYDTYASDDTPAANPFFLARTGFSNTETYDGRDVLMPRFSFEYNPDSWYSISGGIGLVSGGAPDVFISNSFSNTGVLTAAIDVRRTATNSLGGFCTENNSGTLLNAQQCGILLNLDRSNPQTFFELPSGDIAGSAFGAQTLVVASDPLNPANAASPLANAQEVNALSPSFEIPSDWKANLSFNAELLGLSWGLNVVATRSNEPVAFTDLRAQPLVVPNPTAADIAAGVVTGQQFTPDGRIRYDGLSGLNTAGRTLRGMGVTSPISSNRDIVGYNPGEESWTTVAAVSVGQQYDNGLAFQLSWARQEGENFGSYADFGTTASGFYGEQYSALDPNTSVSGRPAGEITDSVKFDFGWRGTPIGDLESRLSLFGERRDGRPVNFLMSQTGSGRLSVFGVNRADQLLYVPNLANCTPVGGASTAVDCGLVRFTDATQLSVFRSIVDRYGLSEGIVPKSAANNPDVTQIDLQFSQELPGLMRGHRTRIQFDIQNLANLLNDEWGLVEEFTNSRAGGRVASVSCLTATNALAGAGDIACSRYQYGNVTTSDFNQAPQVNANESRWFIQVGLRYEF
jgi:hypothetical protein